mgnify:FL=1
MGPALPAVRSCSFFMQQATTGWAPRLKKGTPGRNAGRVAFPDRRSGRLVSEHSHTRPAGRGYCGNTLQCMPSMILAARMGADRCGEGEGASGAPDLQGDQRTGEKVGERASFKGKRSGQI